jgi:hypothetical protein
MRPIIFLLTFLALNCASLLPKDQREVTRIHDIKGTKKDLYDKSLEFFAKNMGNSLQAIQIKDAERGKLVINGYVNCTELNGMRYGMSSAQNITFGIDLTIKDNKIRLIFENIIHTSKGNSMEIDQGPSSSEQVDEIVTTCLAPIERNYLAYVRGGGSSRSDNF